MKNTHMLIKLIGLVMILSISSASTFAKEKSASSQSDVEKSAEQIQWESQVPKGRLNRGAFRYVIDDPNLPRVLLIGDSISIGYTNYVRQNLKGIANVHRVPANAGSTLWTSPNLTKDKWLGHEKWDVIHFNCGLHDLKHMLNHKMNSKGKQISTVESYAKNLQQIIVKLKATGAKLIFATTTPVPEGHEGFIAHDEIRYNEAAVKMMKKHHVDINDLHKALEGKLKEFQRPHNVHYFPKGSAFLAKYVTQHIKEALDTKTK